MEVPHDKSKSTVMTKMQDMLEKVDKCPLTRKQKLKLFRAGVCPRLTWLLSIEEFSASWVEKQLHSLATQYVKKWAGLAKLLVLPFRICLLKWVV